MLITEFKAGRQVVATFYTDSDVHLWPARLSRREALSLGRWLISTLGAPTTTDDIAANYPSAKEWAEWYRNHA